MTDLCIAHPTRVPSLLEARLIGLAAGLGAPQVAGLSREEDRYLSTVAPASTLEVSRLRDQVHATEDPLGEAFCSLRSPEERRPKGATYTPQAIVRAMLDWAMTEGIPTRVVDAGAGSARFLLEAGRRFPQAQLIGVELDPLAALLARANLAAVGFADRAEVRVSDYRALQLGHTLGRTLFVGNPPYVRHHLVEPQWKEWLTRESAARGLNASQLAGLHVHFFLATAKLARLGDFAVFITAAEWLDVNYGRLVRDLFLGELGGQSILVIEPTARAFSDAAATAAITTFKIGSSPRSICLRRAHSIEDVGTVGAGESLRRDRFAAEQRWSHLSRSPRDLPKGFVELGELCRVHRGQVTGANRVWIAGEHSERLPAFLFHSAVTRAQEIIRANGILADATQLRTVIDIPADLDSLTDEQRRAVEGFLGWARRQGADKGYIARHRRAWWSVGLRQPPAILATYMARRPPAFALNRAAARYINIAHGIYPRESWASEVVVTLAEYLVRSSFRKVGRVYSGGLIKLEPREMERISVPHPDLLAAGSWE